MSKKKLHSDCKHYDDGWCDIKNRPIRVDSPFEIRTCKNWEPKRKKRKRR